MWKDWNNEDGFDNDSDSDLNGDVFRREEVRLRGGIEKAELVVVVTDRNRRRNRGRRKGGGEGFRGEASTIQVDEWQLGK